MNDTAAWPTEIRLDREKRLLTIIFDDGTAPAFSAEFLRVFSPSAEVQGHSPAQRRLVVAKERVRIDAIEPVGNYAVKLVFDDGHATGIFSWAYFQRLAADRDTMWAGYLKELEEKGFSRRAPT
ncbi:MAG: gamma-butyrobetaine hydroxylase-like domain-containing protein [Bauldia sp.]